jgi:hypothetical protein
MGEAARAWVRDRFAAARMADDIAALYAELIARHARTGSVGP